MRICIEATSLLVRSAGVKNHVYYWMRTLKEVAPHHEITAYPLLGEIGDLDHEGSVLTLMQTLPRLALVHFLNIRGNPAINAVLGKYDVFHASNVMQNLPSRPKLTGTIFDMTTALLPEVHTPANIKAEKRYHERVLKHADALIAISESAKSDAVRLLGLDEKRIMVIPPGIHEPYYDAKPLKREKPYVLYVGTVEPRKNIDTLLDAWLALPIEMRQEHDLLISGPIGWAAPRTIERVKSGIVGVKYVGYTPEPDLPALTAGATVFVYPSLYEGFGLPAAQAMAAGVPVVTSNLSSLPEVVGDAGILIDPKNSFALRDAIQTLLLSSSMREELGKRGRERAKRFTWKNSAVRSAEFFERVAG